ncbi:TPA: tail fiber domain-containing protein [Citrobacter freundii]|uniref:tail fiber domain-containing protein n=1 Tax=Citrobacter freundii TaxID=546 RepID=UPI00193C8000|nr:tail fiber domain-containing protein [Citrobacter freundii]MBM3010931.1 tail fiber domain-containing protein [Citrobacter freundii]HAU4304059.1 tail fiber domain-containing protein [Citrobacter freundii]HAU5690605.1 tail fiber domain-containing protein [Citrobacter freundii]HCD8286245.1 tail fiber domain-containing protein [Citrobacter freundii]HCD8301627.1 tail fiber domain-containing protein [Citrobacter freundii]
MSAGTLTLTNNSAVVAGSGTVFTTEVAAGDFIVVTVGGVPYTLPVKSVESGTALTLVSNYTGPTQSGAAWSAVPRVALNMVTAALVAQSAEALRGLNYDKQNWQQLFSAPGMITVKLPDGSSFPGPSWKYLADNMATKSDGAVPVNQGGTGSTTASGARSNLSLGDSATRNVGTATGTVAAGDDARLNSVDGKTGGTISTPVYSVGASGVVTQSSSYGEWSFLYPSTLKKMAYGFCENFGDLVFVTTVATNTGTEKYFSMRQNGNFNTQGNITCVSLTQTSDADKKDDIKPIEDALGKVMALNGVTFNWKDSGLPSSGVIAQELIKVLPEAVGSVFEDHDQYESVEEINAGGETTITRHLVKKRDDSKRSYTVEYSGVVALCLQAIKELNEKVESMREQSSVVKN